MSNKNQIQSYSQVYPNMPYPEERYKKFLENATGIESFQDAFIKLFECVTSSDICARNQDFKILQLQKKLIDRDIESYQGYSQFYPLGPVPEHLYSNIYKQDIDSLKLKFDSLFVIMQGIDNNARIHSLVMEQLLKELTQRNNNEEILSKISMNHANTSATEAIGETVKAQWAEEMTRITVTERKPNSLIRSSI